MSEHDPMCGRLTPTDCPCRCLPDRGDVCYHRCTCDLIASVRADERERCAERVEAVERLGTDWDGCLEVDVEGFLIYRADALDAIRQNSPAPGQEGTVDATEPRTGVHGGSDGDNGSEGDS